MAAEAEAAYACAPRYPGEALEAAAVDFLHNKLAELGIRGRDGASR
jgi:hypothetical protein